VKTLTLIMILLIISACSSIEILDGLCYNDHEGTHICPKDSDSDFFPEGEEDGINIDPIPNPSPHKELWDSCSEWMTFDQEAWINCITRPMDHDERIA